MNLPRFPETSHQAGSRTIGHICPYESIGELGPGAFKCCPRDSSNDGSVRVGHLEPIYQSIEYSDLESDQGEEIHPAVKKTHSYPPPPPTHSECNARTTTFNNLYASRGGVMSHPLATRDTTTFPQPREAETEYPVDDTDPLRWCRVVCLTVLVLVSLIMACGALLMVSLLWLEVFVPSATCVPEVDQFDGQAVAINGSVNQLQANLSMLQAEVARSLKETEDIIDSVNNTCTETLEAFPHPNVSLAGLSFEAELLNVGLYNSCIYEYLDECRMPAGTDNCSTDPYDVTVPGYFNLDIDCHSEISESDVTLGHAMISNIRMTNANGATFAMDASASNVSESDQMRCDCAVVALFPVERTLDFMCRLFRARCPIINTFSTIIVTP